MTDNTGMIQIHPSATLLKKFTYPRPKGGECEIHYWRPPTCVVTLAGFSTSAIDGKPETIISSAAAVYTQRLVASLGDPEQEASLIKDMKLTRLATPLEMVHVQFVISGVSRSFTHQIVRYRVGTSFVQLSLRTAGQLNRYHVLVGRGIQGEENLQDYYHAVNASIVTYDNLSHNMPMTEDTKGLLPHNILTGIYVSFSLRSLINIFSQRLCCQAQPGEWQAVLFQVRAQIREKMGDSIAEFLRSNWERGKDCGFHASIDRACRWRGKAISEIARDEWNLPYVTQEDLLRGEV